jgi:DMSO/TMAO reductase YedYZ molybdopterin-dependent catalytic subunit
VTVRIPAIRVFAAPTQPAPPRLAAPAGILAAIVAGVGMLLLRATLEVRSVPERVMELLLVFVPPGLFESMLRQFGFDAKRYALDGAILVLLACLAGVGYVALRRGWSYLHLAGLAVGFWLIVMLVIMPLTSAGFFALALLDGKRAAILGYFAVGLSYTATLAGARAWIDASLELPRHLAERLRPYTRAHRPTRPRLSNSGQGLGRRAALSLAGTTGAAYVVTYAAVLLLPKSSSVPRIMLVDPQEPVLSGGVDPPNPHPQSVVTPVAGSQASGPTPTPGRSATQALPEPAGVRQLARDKDGAVLPSGRVPGQLAGPMTANADFYVVTKNAGGDPTIHPDDWRLLVDGEVQRAFQLDYATLRKLPAVDVVKTLECISNFVGKPELAPFGAELISTATWRGARVSDVLQLTGGPRSSATWMAVLAADEYTSAIPMEVAQDPGTLLVYEMNGEVLPREHGYPTRLLIPNRYGMKNAKWVIGLRPMTREFLDWYGQRNWSKEGIVRTMTRIDAPAPGAVLPAGPQSVAGVAYAGARGIQKVEISTDAGDTWRNADILEPSQSGQDRWVRWRADVQLAPGATVKVVARATDGAGTLAEQPFSLPEPDGGTGWPTVEFRSA